MHDFRECLDDMRLGLLPRKGCRYSWSNKKEAEDRIYSLIYWALGNDQWYLKVRQNKNKITSICNELGVGITDPVEVQQEFVKFFKELQGTCATEMPS